MRKRRLVAVLNVARSDNPRRVVARAFLNPFQFIFSSPGCVSSIVSCELVRLHPPLQLPTPTTESPGSASTAPPVSYPSSPLAVTGRSSLRSYLGTSHEGTGRSARCLMALYAGPLGFLAMPSSPVYSGVQCHLLEDGYLWWLCEGLTYRIEL